MISKREGDKYMRLAVKEARKNIISMEGGPFGACVVKGNSVVAVARNTVLKNDATCHAEINAIRIASKITGSFDLTGCVIYSTTEPCPMCLSAIHWARIKKVVYGTTIKDAAKIGFNELGIPGRVLARLGKSKVIICQSRLLGECRKLFHDWDVLPNKKLY
ncbi:MAG: nucleoside deaminase [Candidatus Omnitrophica bacterium]|nr:nucleoside deaminase [Candidatus Omnitrophota bacterium]